jgi:hypothetical protein
LGNRGDGAGLLGHVHGLWGRGLGKSGQHWGLWCIGGLGCESRLGIHGGHMHRMRSLGHVSGGLHELGSGARDVLRLGGILGSILRGRNGGEPGLAHIGWGSCIPRSHRLLGIHWWCHNGALGPRLWGIPGGVLWYTADRPWLGLWGISHWGLGRLQDILGRRVVQGIP